MPEIQVGQENSAPIHLHYEDHGHGPAIVLIHGYPFFGGAWEQIESRLLTSGFRVIHYDRRGFGMSSQPSVGYNYDTFAADLKVLLDHLDLQDATLVGHSMGTGEIARYVSRFQAARVGRAVFVSPIPPFLLKTSDNPEGVDSSVFEDFKEKIRKDRYAFITSFLKDFYGIGLLGKPVSEEKLRADFQVASFCSPIAFIKSVDAWLEDFRDDLREITIPSVIIHGDNDKILPIEATARRMSKMMNIDLVEIPGGSHGIPWTHPDDICEVIEDIIVRTSGVPKKAEVGEGLRDLH